MPVEAALIKAAILRLVSCCWAKSSRCSFSVRHHSCHSLRHRRSKRLRSLSTASWLSLEEVTDVIIFLALNYCLIRLEYNRPVLHCAICVFKALLCDFFLVLACFQSVAPALFLSPLAAFVLPTSLPAMLAKISAASSSHRGPWPYPNVASGPTRLNTILRNASADTYVQTCRTQT